MNNLKLDRVLTYLDLTSDCIDLEANVHIPLDGAF